MIKIIEQVSNGIIENINRTQINYIDTYGDNLLRYANDEETVKYLIDNGVDVNSTNKYGRKVLSYYYSDRHMVDVFVDNGLIIDHDELFEFSKQLIVNGEIKTFFKYFKPEILSLQDRVKLFELVVCKKNLILTDYFLSLDNVDWLLEKKQVIKKLIKTNSLRLFKKIYHFGGFEKDGFDLIKMCLDLKSFNILYYLLKEGLESDAKVEALEYFKTRRKSEYKRLIKYFLRHGII